MAGSGPGWDGLQRGISGLVALPGSADPAELAAYQQAKASLLEQIADTHASDGPDLAGRARHAAAQARRHAKEAR